MPERFVISPDAVANRMGDQIVLVHVGTGRIFELNQSAARIWDLLASGHYRNEILKIIHEEFNISDSIAAQQIEELLDSLTAERIISVHDDDRPSE
jgi:Coenzyme PQQ synthesis protein D (PqqD)